MKSNELHVGPPADGGAVERSREREGKHFYRTEPGVVDVLASSDIMLTERTESYSFKLTSFFSVIISS